jgi:hypothetical protein
MKYDFASIIIIIIQSILRQLIGNNLASYCPRKKKCTAGQYMHSHPR